MRKNGVDKKLKEIPGGVCAPDGFKANGVCCGIVDGETKEDFGLLISDKRCPVACVYASGGKESAPVAVTKKHIKDGYAQAVVFNSGRANVFQENGEKIAKELCALVGRHAKIDLCDIVIASTGRIEKPLQIEPFEKGVVALIKGVSADGSETLARTLMTSDRRKKEFSYSFALGDYTVKIGAVLKGNRCVSPNMATVLGVITTDAHISPAMLQRALTAEAKESFNQLSVDGISSPNDMLCIMANGRAGNYKIDCVDSEYKKFAFALHEVALRMCREILADYGEKKRFVCTATGLKSKQLSRTVAKAIVCADAFKNELAKGGWDAERLLYAIWGAGAETESLQVTLRSEKGGLVLFEDKKVVRCAKERIAEIVSAEEVEIVLAFEEGNYTSSAQSIL